MPEFINLSFTGILDFLISLSPILISFFLILGSFLNQEAAKGGVYLGGVLIMLVIGILLKKLFNKSPPDEFTHENCTIFDIRNIDLLNKSTPDLHSMFLAFTTLYLILPMIHHEAQVNPYLLIVMSIFVIGNAITRIKKKCNNIIDIVSGILIGGGFGTAWFYIFWATNNHKLLFIDSLVSNKVICNRPAKQTFKCSVYKNGQLIKNL